MAIVAIPMMNIMAVDGDDLEMILVAEMKMNWAMCLLLLWLLLLLLLPRQLILDLKMTDVTMKKLTVT